MRFLILAVFMLLLPCSLCVPLHAQQDTSCKAPKATPGQTKEQQEAAASGYLAGCKSATATDSHALHTEPPGEASVDEYAPDLPIDPAEWSADKYFEWLHENGCTNLLQEVQDKFAQHHVPDKNLYLARVAMGVHKNNDQCD